MLNAKRPPPTIGRTFPPSLKMPRKPWAMCRYWRAICRQAWLRLTARSWDMRSVLGWHAKNEPDTVAAGELEEWGPLNSFVSRPVSSCTHWQLGLSRVYWGYITFATREIVGYLPISQNQHGEIQNPDWWNHRPIVWQTIRSGLGRTHLGAAPVAFQNATFAVDAPLLAGTDSTSRSIEKAGGPKNHRYKWSEIYIYMYIYIYI